MKHKKHSLERIAKRAAKALGLRSAGRLIHHATDLWPRYMVHAAGEHHATIRPCYPLRHAPISRPHITVKRSASGKTIAARIRKEIKPQYRKGLRVALHALAATQKGQP